jgi:hypothetical protein
MSSIKAPMSTGYKAVFALSILMIFVVILGGAWSQSKSVGFGIWYWGYTAWKMYKRDNDSLVSLQKFMLWFEAIAFSIGLAVLLFSDSDVRRYVDITPLWLIILASLSMGVTYLLYKFFKKQQSAPTTFTTVSGSSIDDRFWEQASRELEGDRHRATWARAMAIAEGDESKTKALYLKIRASELNSQSVANSVKKSSFESVPKAVIPQEGLFWSKFNVIGKTSIIGMLLLCVYGLYDLFSGISASNSEISPPPSFPISSSPSTTITVPVDVGVQPKVPLFRYMSDGTTMRWSLDKECFVKMVLDLSNAASPVTFFRTSNYAGSQFTELTQVDKVVAVLFYDSDLPYSTVKQYLGKTNFLKIKAMCEL